MILPLVLTTLLDRGCDDHEGPCPACGEPVGVGGFAPEGYRERHCWRCGREIDRRPRWIYPAEVEA